jgi:hypothetical protein
MTVPPTLFLALWSELQLRTQQNSMCWSFLMKYRRGQMTIRPISYPARLKFVCQRLASSDSGNDWKTSILYRLRETIVCQRWYQALLKMIGNRKFSHIWDSETAVYRKYRVYFCYHYIRFSPVVIVIKVTRAALPDHWLLADSRLFVPGLYTINQEGCCLLPRCKVFLRSRSRTI